MINIAQLRKAWRKFRAIIASGVVGVLIGTLATQYGAFVTQNRTAIEADYQGFKGTTNDVFQLLDAYANRARAGGSVDDDTQKKFRMALLKAYSQAEAIARREPRANNEFFDYAESLLILRDASEFAGPLDANKFVEATSRYLDASSKFENRITKLQNSFLRTIF